MRLFFLGFLAVSMCFLAQPAGVSFAHQDKEKKEVVEGNDIGVDYATNEARADAKYQGKVVRLTPGIHLARLIITKVAKDGKDYVLIIRGFGGDNRERCYVHCYGIDKETLQNAPIGKIVGVNVEQPRCVIEGEFGSYKVVSGNNVVTLKNCSLKR